jgi:hypothetical protein
MKSIALLSLVVAPFVVACSISSSNSDPPPGSLHSANVATNQMRASFSAQSGDSNVKVYASVFAKNANGDSVGVALDQGDYFTASVAGSAPITLTVEPAENTTIPYTATLPLATAAEDITIALVRGNGQVSAPRSVIHLPAPFTIVANVPPTVKIGTNIPFRIDPATFDSLEMEVVGDCIADNSDGYDAPTLDDTGSGVMNTAQIKLKNGSGCSTDLYLDIYGSDGSVDSAFAGGLTGLGDVLGEQRRAVTTSLTP